MGTTFKEFKRKVLLNLPNVTEGESLMVIEEAINTAHRIIATIKDFDELIVLDTTHALTVVDQKLYHIETDLLLTRPKDILTIRYMDEGSSRKLIYVPYRQLDDLMPYTEQTGSGKPTYYTRRGAYIELYQIPDEAKPLYIMYTQWPDTLVNDDDETPYTTIDHVITSLSIEISVSMLAGVRTDWETIANNMLIKSVIDDMYKPDELLIAQPFTTRSNTNVGEYWSNPFIKKSS